MPPVDGIFVHGPITREEVAEAISKYFPDKVVRVEESKEIKPISETILVTDYSIDRHKEKQLQGLLEQKEKQLRELETSNTKALTSIQAFHKQQQALFDEFVLLRQRYDEQKTSLLAILWVQCGQYHPELRQIPFIEDEETFIERDEQVGLFSVGETLGEGQFATVKTCWRIDGKRNGEDKDFALKIIKKERITTFQSLRRVSNEIEILRRLKSKYVVGIREVMQTQKRLYIVTEKGGADLFEFFDEHPEGVPEVWAKEILAYILRAVCYCHDQGVCHRDLKPENILLTFDYETKKCVDLKLCDFGLSTQYLPKVLLSDFCGSPGFFGPEMITHGSYYGDKVDIWSVGCILLELVLGHERFCDMWMTAYDYEILQDKERFTEEITKTVDRLPEVLNFSEQLNDFILRFLKLKSSERPLTKSIMRHKWLEGVIPVEVGRPLSLQQNLSSPGGAGGDGDESYPSPGRNLTVTTNRRSFEFEVSQKERKKSADKTVHLPPVEPSTPNVTKARKMLHRVDELQQRAESSLEPVGGGGTRSNGMAESPLLKKCDSPRTTPRENSARLRLDSIEENAALGGLKGGNSAVNSNSMLLESVDAYASGIFSIGQSPRAVERAPISARRGSGEGKAIEGSL